MLNVLLIQECSTKSVFFLTGDVMPNLLNFGYCHVDCPYQESFTMTNHSSGQVVRFEWPPAGAHVFFSPQVKH